MTGKPIPEEVVQIASDIKNMRIRGAGRIARAGALALRIAAEKYTGQNLDDFKEYIRIVADYVVKTRPTAVSLPNAVSYVVSPLLRADSIRDVEEAKRMIIENAEKFMDYSERAVERIAEIGSRLLRDGDTVLTHCNSQVVVSVIKAAVKQGKSVEVIATETRPLFQGHITIKMLLDAGVDAVTLVPDSAVRSVIKDVDKVIVGADTVTANGAVVNKVGTSLIALIARERGIDFYVATETYKFSPYTVWGELVVIEERTPTEVLPEDVIAKNPYLKVFNPSFDVTPPYLVTAIITEIGLIPPQASLLVLEELYGRGAIHDTIQTVEEE
ncbi:ribose 1,5-bisphosphate isomerase [Infirmifilum lucidum]|uniref:Ribose 1,5-bisphosphate isomerase n=1 Tax=Infirmifilum lucidum TaxID=2776706 RepID=A0A7L9FF46_9CREN|nr:ribose 1,5-bisphosphate isomerase [Infirmifilum lucidum]QOJ78251.1 ribose 1,5-bisphosphate isomerase [Infirmifilum lucidum]